MLLLFKEVSDFFQLCIIVRCEIDSREVLLKRPMNEIILASFLVHNAEVIGKVKQEVSWYNTLRTLSIYDENVRSSKSKISSVYVRAQN